MLDAFIGYFDIGPSLTNLTYRSQWDIVRLLDANIADLKFYVVGSE